MPIYEYRCSTCGHQLEVLQKLSEPRLTGCPECGKPTLAKLLSAAGFQLKGSGWYATDFKSSGAKPAAKPAHGKDGESKGADAKAESKGETKSGGSTESASTTSPPATAPAIDAVK
jgi:putative FmdB family regulatory protein